MGGFDTMPGNTWKQPPMSGGSACSGALQHVTPLSATRQDASTASEAILDEDTRHGEEADGDDDEDEDDGEMGLASVGDAGLDIQSEDASIAAVPEMNSLFDVRHGAGQGQLHNVNLSKQNASYFVSSPGAVSSETRDASIHQGKFDMCRLLQFHLPQDTPSLVCDVTSGQVIVTNAECVDLFECNDSKTRLLNSVIFTYIHPDDHDKFSTCLAYLMVSERSQMAAQDVRIVTARGRTRNVRAEGIQLVGLWWQLDIHRRPDDAETPS